MTKRKTIVVTHRDLERFLNEWEGWRNAWRFDDALADAISQSWFVGNVAHVPPGAYELPAEARLFRQVRHPESFTWCTICGRRIPCTPYGPCAVSISFADAFAAFLGVDRLTVYEAFEEGGAQ